MPGTPSRSGPRRRESGRCLLVSVLCWRYFLANHPLSCPDVYAQVRPSADAVCVHFQYAQGGGHDYVGKPRWTQERVLRAACEMLERRGGPASHAGETSSALLVSAVPCVVCSPDGIVLHCNLPFTQRTG